MPTNNKGGKAATRTLTSMIRECKQYRDEMKTFAESASKTATEIDEVCNRATVTCILSAAGGIIANIALVIYYVCL